MLSGQWLRAKEMPRRGTGVTLTPNMNIGQENDDEVSPKEYRYSSKFIMVVGKVLLQEAYNLRVPDKKGVACRLCRHITAGAWNVQGMTQGKMTVVEIDMERCGLAVMGIAEHWWLGQGRFSTAEGSTIMYSGKESGRRSAGVGFMVNNETSRTVLGYNPVSERVTTLRMNAKPVNITFVQVYAPTGASSEEEITAFYEHLQWVLDNVMEISGNPRIRVTS